MSDDALREELEELRERIARRAQFVAILAHDVRTPLASIVGSVHTLQQRGGELSPEQRGQLIAVIGREADRLANLLDEAFDTARIDTDTFMRLRISEQKRAINSEWPPRSWKK